MTKRLLIDEAILLSVLLVAGFLCGVIGPSCSFEDRRIPTCSAT